MQFPDVHLIMLDHTHSVLCLKFEICRFCTLAKFRADVLFPHNFLILLHAGKQISSPLLRSSAKSLEKEN